MIRLVIKNGVQTLTEICDDCKCHVRNLTTDDIMVKGNTDLIIKNSQGQEVTRKKHNHMTCKCEHCS